MSSCTLMSFQSVTTPLNFLVGMKKENLNLLALFQILSIWAFMLLLASKNSMEL